MVKVEYFNIQLQNTAGIFRPGDTVAGTISYKITKRGKINQVRLEAAGDGYVHWTEQHGSGKHRHTVSYTGYELFYKFQQVYETKIGKEDFYLEEGEYSHPFQFVLPPMLPSSAEHFNGRNRYSIMGTIDIPWAFNKNCSRIISVISTVDLNLIPAIREPSKVTQSKTVCCWCCKSEPIVMTLTIRKGGYVAGETIYAEFTIENPTSRKIKPPTLFLHQILYLNARTKTRTVNRVAASVVLGRGVEAKSNDTFNAELVVPATCPSTLNTARVFVVAYQVGITAPISGPAIDAGLAMPVVIGTIPIGGGGGGQQQPASIQPSVFGGIENPNLHQEERKGEAFSNDTNTFKPQYPYFQDFSLRS